MARTVSAKKGIQSRSSRRFPTLLVLRGPLRADLAMRAFRWRLGFGRALRAVRPRTAGRVRRCCVRAKHPLWRTLPARAFLALRRLVALLALRKDGITRRTKVPCPGMAAALRARRNRALRAFGAPVAKRRPAANSIAVTLRRPLILRRVRAQRSTKARWGLPTKNRLACKARGNRRTVA